MRDNETAFDRFVETHRERVTRLAHRILGWPTDVDDVVQDVFLAAYRAIDQFRGHARIETWLTTITLNKCRTARRRQWLRRRLWRRLRERPIPPAPMADTPVRQAERNQIVQNAVRRLPAPAREIIVLRYLEDLPIDAIATLLGLSRNAAEVRLTRARQRLRTLLPADWEA